jgi:hypothetical protein
MNIRLVLSMALTANNVTILTYNNKNMDIFTSKLS